MKRSFFLATLLALVGCTTPYYAMSPAEQLSADIAAAREGLERKHYLVASQFLVAALQKPDGKLRVAQLLGQQAGWRQSIIDEAMSWTATPADPSTTLARLRELNALTEPLPTLTEHRAVYERETIRLIRTGALMIAYEGSATALLSLSNPNDLFDVLIDGILNGSQMERQIDFAYSVPGVSAHHPAAQRLLNRFAQREWSFHELQALRSSGVRAANQALLDLDETIRVKYSAFIERAKNSITRDLRDPEAVRFRDLFLSQSGTTTVLCGELNGKNAYGAYIGYARFFSAGDGALQARESTDTRWSFGELWAKHCTDQIGPVSGPKGVAPTAPGEIRS